MNYVIQENQKPLLVIVSGMAGAGKSIALRALEDMNFHCIDNLPIPMIYSLIEMITSRGSYWEKLAIALDSRDPLIETSFDKTIQDLKKHFNLSIIYLEAQSNILLKRFKETRRPHPLEFHEDTKPISLLNAIEKDKKILENVKINSSFSIDTSYMTGHFLRRYIRDHFAGIDKENIVKVQLISFGFKHEPPQDLDLMFDVRCFRNPHYVSDLRPLTGLNKQVKEYVFEDPNVEGFLKKTTELIAYMYPLYCQEGKSYLAIGIGCTGGKHRSVAIAEELLVRFSSFISNINVEHRHFDRE